MGDFIPETSDVDVLAVTKMPITEAEFAKLLAWHEHLTTVNNPYAQRLELAYIDEKRLRRFEPGQRYPTLGQGETLTWMEHHSNWILERWTVREHGLTLFGPEPETLIDPVSAETLIQAVQARLPDWADWAKQSDDPDWLLPRSHKAYVIETMCRALHTLACGQLSSKAKAVAWASTRRSAWVFSSVREVHTNSDRP